MEHFLEGIAPLRQWYINPNEKSNNQGDKGEVFHELNSKEHR